MRRHAGAVVLMVLAGGARAYAADVGGNGPPLNVFAAASLTASFQAIGKAFEAQHPHTKLTFNFAGSPTLVRQILNGAPADVFASADPGNMQRLSEERAIAGEPQIFAHNLLQIIVATGNPKHIAGLADLTRPGLIVVLCGDTVPVGRYALEAFKKAGLTPPAGSRELDVKAVVSKVQLGEADAGIVYVTDVHAGGDTVEGVVVPESHNVVAQYPIATVATSQHKDDARTFIAFVRSAAAQKILLDSGFLLP